MCWTAYPPLRFCSLSDGLTYRCSRAWASAMSVSLHVSAHTLTKTLENAHFTFDITNQICHNIWIITKTISSLIWACPNFIQQHTCYTFWVITLTFLSATNHLCHWRHHICYTCFAWLIYLCQAGSRQSTMTTQKVKKYEVSNNLRKMDLENALQILDHIMFTQKPNKNLL